MDQKSEVSGQKSVWIDGGVDTGLLMLVALTPPGRKWTQEEIAFVCGCCRNNIWLIEQRALKKLRRALQARVEEQELLRSL